MVNMIRVCEPVIGNKEMENVMECLKTNWISSKGRFIDEFERGFAKLVNAKHGITTTNGTTALHLAVEACGIKRGDEVIIPSFTMISTAFSTAYAGAKPVLVDSELETWNMDVSKIQEKITKKTKAIMPVHTYGHPVDMDPILELAEDHNLKVIEDAAEAHGAEYKGKIVGCLGDAGCFSFYANKIITTGEGGIVVTNDDKFAERASFLKDLAFPRGKGRVYLHDEIGFNYRLSNIHAAIGAAQLEKFDQHVEIKRRMGRLYNSLLKDVSGITLPPEKPWAKNVFWMYGMLVEDDFGVSREKLMERLEKRGIETRMFFIPISRQPAFTKLGLFKNEKYPIADELSRKGLYLPSGLGLTEDEIKTVCEAIKDIQNKGE